MIVDSLIVIRNNRQIVQPLGSLVRSLTNDQIISSSISGSAVEFLSSFKLSHGIYGLGVPVIQCPLSIFCPVLSSEEAPTLR